MDMNETQARLARLLSYLEVDGKNFALLSDASDLSLQLGDWGGARNLVACALELQPRDAVTLYRMACILLHEFNADRSLAITQGLLDAGETQAAVRFAHARGLVMASRFAEAEPVLVSLLPEAADFPALPHLYIRTLHYLGQVEAAIAFAESYSEQHPDDAMAQGMISLLYLDNDDIAQAAEQSAKALERAPDNMDALLAAGSVALAYEMEGAAKEHFDRALALHDKSGRAWTGLGLVNMLETDLPAARNAFGKAIECMPTHLGTYIALAWVQICQQDYRAAKKTLETVLAIDQTFGETHGGLAVLAALEQDWDNAKRLADVAVRLAPESFSGRFAHSLVMTHRGRPERAQTMLETALKNFDAPGGGSLADAVQRFGRRQQNQRGTPH